MDTSKQMPNLMGVAHGAADGNRRILAQLEHGARVSRRANRPARTWHFDGWTMGLVVLLLTIGGVAWLMHEETITPVTFKSHASNRRTVENTAAGMAAIVPAANFVEETRPAAIVNEIRMTAGHQTAVGTSGKTAQRTADHASTQRPAARRDQLAQSVPAQRSGRGAVPAGAVPAGAVPAATSDSDITLLTALVAHAGKPASVAPERSRDVVERADGMQTAELLARCKQLGLMEGMLCRSRICSGSWESDPACSAPAQ